MEQKLLEKWVEKHIKCIEALIRQKTVMSKIGDKHIPFNQVIGYMNLDNFEHVNGYAVGLLYQDSAEEPNTYGIFDLKTQRMFNNNPIDSFYLCEIDYAKELHMESDLLTQVADILINSNFKIETIAIESPIYATTDKIRDLLSNFADFLVEKNNRYGDAALNPKKRFNKGDAESSICIRLDDKLDRIEVSEVLRKNDIADVAGYLILLMIEKGWLTFDDLLD